MRAGVLSIRLLRFSLKQRREQRADQQEKIGAAAVAEVVGDILHAVTQGFHVSSLRSAAASGNIPLQGKPSRANRCRFRLAAKMIFRRVSP